MISVITIIDHYQKIGGAKRERDGLGGPSRGKGGSDLTKARQVASRDEVGMIAPSTPLEDKLRASPFTNPLVAHPAADHKRHQEQEEDHLLPVELIRLLGCAQLAHQYACHHEPPLRLASLLL